MSDNESDAGEYKWWEDDNANVEVVKGGRRWETLEHQGVHFPPAYVPHGIPIKYNGEIFKMTPEEEEVATMFAGMKTAEQYYHRHDFRTNFFEDWKKILDKRKNNPIQKLALCDFSAIFEHIEAQRAAKKALPREEKKRLKAEDDAATDRFKFATFDGRKEKVANFRVEPPGLFRGRGEHPLQGKLKVRVYPEDITINIGEKDKIPPAPEGHQWGEIVHDHTVTWLASWKDNVTGNSKYVMMGNQSAIKQATDREKFDRARRLNNDVDKIRQRYRDDWNAADVGDAQRAVALYFIDKLALRCGNEKGDDEAETFGCCSLRTEHVRPIGNNTLRFDFPGKDSIQYVNDVEVDPIVYGLVSNWGKRSPGNVLFHQTNSTQLNDYLKQFSEDLTAKVFRTYNASITLDRFFRENPCDKSLPVLRKVEYFNEANKQVAILCNHQKSVSKGHKVSMEKLDIQKDQNAEIIERLEKAKQTEKKKGFEAACKEFLDEEDRIQWEWLDNYGSEKEKEDYKAWVEARDSKKVVKRDAPSKPKSSPPASSKRKREADDSDDDEPLAAVLNKKAGKAADKKSPAKKPAAKASKPAAKASKPAAKASKKDALPKKRSKKEEDSDDDKPLAALV